MEGKVVEAYVKLKQEEESLVEVETTGLHIHPTLGFLAASPDRLVEDSSVMPSSGLLEVKFLASVNGPPEEVARGQLKSSFCLEALSDGKVRLKSSHNFYQVQGQMACIGHSWCDFVCQSKTGHLFCERVLRDESFWLNCIPLLTSFFEDFLAPEIVCPPKKD